MKKVLSVTAIVWAMCVVLTSCSSSSGWKEDYDDDYQNEANNEQTQSVDLYTYGFDQLRKSKRIRWVEIKGYSFAKGIAYSDDFTNYACYIFENGYRFYDYRSNDGVPTGNGTEPVKYTYINNNNINLANGDSINITKRNVYDNIVIIQATLYRAGKSDVERWFIPYEMIDWNTAPIREGYEVTYTLIQPDTLTDTTESKFENWLNTFQ